MFCVKLLFICQDSISPRPENDRITKQNNFIAQVIQSINSRINVSAFLKLYLHFIYRKLFTFPLLNPPKLGPFTSIVSPSAID